MWKKYLVILPVLILIIWALFFSKQPSNGIILFYGDGCPHCQNVEDFLKNNKVEEKVKFERKEVFNNPNNSRLLTEKASKCGLPTDSISVPFLWTGSTCIVGDQDTINFFKEKLKT